MGTFKVNGELDINSYLTAASTLYLSSKDATSIIFRVGNSQVGRFNPKGCFNINTSQTGDTYKLYCNGKAYFNDTVTATSFIGDLTGNADTADKWATPRTLTIGSTGKSVDGSENVSWSHAEIGATVSNAWSNGSTAGPKLVTTVNGVASAETTVPTATTARSGVVTTGAQRFRGSKILEYPAISSYSSRYLGFYYKNNAETTVGEHWYDVGDATNITTGKYNWRQFSPNSTANTATTGYHETYSLPTVTAGLTANKTYEIFTSKSYSTLDTHNDARYVNVTGDTMTGRLTTTGLTISTTDAAGHISFSRASANYFTAPEGGYFTFLTNGKTLSIANSDLIVADGQVYPGTNNYTSLGTSSRRWTSIYCSNSITISGTTDAVMDATTSNPRIIFAEGGAQPVALVYTDYNNYRSPAGLKVLGLDSDASPAWFEVEGNIYGTKVYGAVWNDYAEFRTQKEEIKPGYCVVSSDDGYVSKTTERLQPCDGIVSDTYGFSIGETEENKTPLAVAGRVLAYVTGNKFDYHAGDTVAAGPDGRIVKMTREEIEKYPDRIVGIVSEIPKYEEWGTGKIKVNNRIWIKVK